MLRITAQGMLILIAGSFAHAADRPTVVAAVRDYAQNYTRRLPNYTCVLATKHTTRRANAVNDPSIETTFIEEQLSFVDQRELRKIVKTDGALRDAVTGPLSSGEFGNLLAIIADPASGSDLRWNRAATLDGHKVDVLSYHVPQSSGYQLSESGDTIRVPFEGLLFADAQSHAVLRIRVKCTGIPEDSKYQTVELTLDYKSAPVAGSQFILPSHFVLTYLDTKLDRQVINDARYSDYRRFSADSSIQFADEK